MRSSFLPALLTALPLAFAPLGAAMAQMPMNNQTPSGQLPPGHPPIDKNAPAAVMHTGTVVETIPAGSYTYVHVNGDAGDQWLAAPAVALKNGAAVRWPEGMLMSNYHSKILDRTFEKVYFVGGVEATK